MTADALNPDFETPDLSLGNPELTTLGRLAIYRSTRELPPAVKDALPADAQDVFLSVINRALKDGDSESAAFQLAWGVIKKTWHKGEVGQKWQRNATADCTTLARLTILNP